MQVIGGGEEQKKKKNMAAELSIHEQRSQMAYFLLQLSNCQWDEC